MTESYKRLLKAAESLSAMDNCNYDRALMQGAWNELRGAIAELRGSHESVMLAEGRENDPRHAIKNALEIELIFRRIAG